MPAELDSEDAEKPRRPWMFVVTKEKERKKMTRTSLKERRIRVVLALFGFAFLLAPLAALIAQTKNTATLTVRVTGARNTKGKIGVALFQGATGFPGILGRPFGSSRPRSTLKLRVPRSFSTMSQRECMRSLCSTTRT